jgi:hypothetical protein
VDKEPPFKAELRHKGWQVDSFNLPQIKDVERAKVLQPAELEV